MSVARQDLKVGSLAAYLAWGLNHRQEIQNIIANVQIMMADFPAVAGADLVPGTNIPSFMTMDTAEDALLRQSISALPDGELSVDNAVLNQLVDTSDPQAARFDGTLLKALLENLPALIQAIQLIMSLFPKTPPAGITAEHA